MIFPVVSHPRQMNNTPILLLWVGRSEKRKVCVKSTRNNIPVPLIIRYLGRRVIPIAINYPVAHIVVQ